MNETTSEKISVLQSLILQNASSQKFELAEGARKESESWLASEMSKLDRETAMILADAKKRAEDVHRRQILAAERQKSTEALRQQNRLLQQALKQFLDGLVKLRDRSDYVNILTALALDGARRLEGFEPVKLRLAAIDGRFGDEVAAEVNAKFPQAGMEFSHEPAPILGGCWIISSDGRRQINSDWQSRTQEVSDTLADRLLAML
ncbi:MAG: V-type proton ATPase subunit E [Synergistaceae bacterium]|jgi:V/A-type H+-transporting ATPase subunit E|nr:V-type proton ATPase subunit E [Synergistaceae bacterium]